MFDDYDLIEASFRQQYGIRLREEMKKMPWDEFCNLLAGLKEDTPLIRMALIRKETDPKKMEHWTDEQKRINREWREKVRKTYLENMTQDDVEAKYAQIRSLFRGNAKK